MDDRLPLTATTFHLLLSFVDGAKHGYGARAEIDARTDGALCLGAGTLYQAIRRLRREELIVETEPPAGIEVGSPRWRFYRITPQGEALLRAELERLEADVGYARAKLAALDPRRAR